MRVTNIFAVLFFTIIVVYIENILYGLWTPSYEGAIAPEYLSASVFGLLMSVDKTLRRRESPCSWWAPPIGIGAGSGVSALAHIPQTSLFHVPFLMVASLVVTILSYDAMKRFMRH